MLSEKNGKSFSMYKFEQRSDQNSYKKHQLLILQDLLILMKEEYYKENLKQRLQEEQEK